MIGFLSPEHRPGATDPTGFTSADSWYIGGKPAITATACSYARERLELRRLLVMSMRVNGLASSSPTALADSSRSSRPEPPRLLS